MFQMLWFCVALLWQVAHRDEAGNGECVCCGQKRPQVVNLISSEAVSGKPHRRQLGLEGPLLLNGLVPILGK